MTSLLASPIIAQVGALDFSISQLLRVLKFNLQRPFSTTNYLKDQKTITRVELTNSDIKFIRKTEDFY